ncbi:major facilitator superfamily domain-containing protein 6-like isoform X2 [Myzus persicae]|nr:major facilitator superfamily domain-containing protein 6-like isoform X2 [Myzus persicae]
MNKNLLLMKIHYFVGIGGYAPLIPFLPTMAKQRGYSSFIVGFIFALMPIPGMLAKVIFGSITDKYNCRRLVFVLSAILTSLLVLIMLLIPNTNTNEEIDDSDAIRSPLFWLFWTTVTLFATTATIKNVLEDTICMDLLGENKHQYGGQRLWGSIGYSLLAIASGLCVDWYSKEQEFKNDTPCFVIALICFILDIFVVSNIKVVQESPYTKRVSSDVKKLLTEVRILAFIVWVVLFGFFVSFIWNFLFWYLEDLSMLYHPETKSWIKTLQGLAILIQCFGGEVPSFFLSGYILKRVGHMNVFSVMFFVYALIFFLFSIIENPVYVLPVEILSGVAFALFYSGAISYADLLSPSGAEGTVQGVVGTALTGIGTPIGSFVGGYMFKMIGSIASFKILSVLVLITCIVQIIVNQMINRFSNNSNIKTTSSKGQPEVGIDFKL